MFFQLFLLPIAVGVLYAVSQFLAVAFPVYGELREPLFWIVTTVFLWHALTRRKGA